MSYARSEILVGSSEIPRGWDDRPVPWKKLLPFMALLPLGFCLQWFLSFFPGAVELIYSRGIYRVIGTFLNFWNSFLSVSLGEIILIALLICIPWWLGQYVVSYQRRYRTLGNLLIHGTANFFAFAGIVYAVFLVLWGFNYYRLPYAKSLGVQVGGVSISELSELAEELIHKVNQLRNQLPEDQSGVLLLESGAQDILRRSRVGMFIASAEGYPRLEGFYTPPKGIYFSALLSWLGTSGVYDPFTGEANVNVDIPSVELPFTACHELAHQRGFAREDEASFIGYIASIMHPDPIYEYSGKFAAMQHVLRTISQTSVEEFMRLQDLQSEAVRRDVQAVSVFWQGYESPVRDVSQKTYHFYLKSQGQREGIRSYDRMTDLLVADWKRRKAAEQQRWRGR